MTQPLRVLDIASYLAGTGWQRSSQEHRGASVWEHSEDYEVLLPATDRMGDAETRVREVLRCLSALERRPISDIAAEIATPDHDRQFFRTHPSAHEPGYTSLPAGVQAVQGVRSILQSAVRTVVQGPHFAFTGRPPGTVSDLLRRVELGPTRPGSRVIEVRLPADTPANGPAVDARAVFVQLHEAVSVANAAVLTGEPDAFDDSVTAGVSADLCIALSDLAGETRSEPFEIDFRWARTRPLDIPLGPVEFPSQAGRLLQLGGRRLRGQNASGPATVTGVVEGLHDDPVGGDRWRIKVRGELRTERTERSRRAVWVRLPDQISYERAIAAHRARVPVSTTGELSSATGRVELVSTGDFDLDG